MSQVEILKNIQKFISLLAKENPAAFKEADQKLLSELLEHGHCSAFSLCYAAMAHIGKLEWWEAALVEITNWDGDAAQLDKVIRLPKADNPTPLFKDILLRVTNYILYYRYKSRKILIPGSVGVTYDKPNNELFEIIDASGNCKRVRSSRHISGNFANPETLQQIFLLPIKNTMCTIHNGKHVVAIVYRNGMWEIYDPNYSHKKIDSLKFASADSGRLAAELLRIQGSVVVFDFVDLYTMNIDFEKLFIDSLSKPHRFELLENQGIHYIKTYNIQSLNARLQEALSDDSNVTPEQLLGCLIAVDNFNESGLQCVANYFHRHHLPAIFAKIKNIPDVSNKVGSIINLRDTLWETTILSAIINYSIGVLPTFLAIVKDSYVAIDNLHKSLLKKDNNGDLPLSLLLLANHADHFIAIFKLLQQKQYFAETIFSWLNYRDKHGRSGLSILAAKAPNHVIEVLNVASGAVLFSKSALLDAHHELARSKFHEVLISKYSFNPGELQVFSVSKHFQLLLIVNQLSGDTETKRSRTVSEIINVLSSLDKPEKVRKFITFLENNRNLFPHIFNRQGTISTFSLYGHHWHGQKCTATWAKIIVLAKEKIRGFNTTLSEADIKFLESPTLVSDLMTLSNKYLMVVKA